MDKSWINMDTLDARYLQGVIDFIEFACENIPDGATEIVCPCKKCRNVRLINIDLVKDHLVCNGFNPSYTRWIFHGENIEASNVGIESSRQGHMDRHDGTQEMLRDAFGIPPVDVYDMDCNDFSSAGVQG